MTIEQTDGVDFVSIDHKSGDVFLLISDHLEWDEDGEHLLLLQEKINAYLRFIESVEIYDRFPQLKGKKIVINVANKFPFSEQADRFFKLASDVITKAGFRLQHGRQVAS